MTYVFDDPSASGPNLLFSDGTVVNGRIHWQITQSNLPGGTDKTWGFVQWSSNYYFNPAAQSAPFIDPVLGKSIGNWTTPEGSAVTIFGYPGEYIYRLTTTGGNLKDVFLQNAIDAAAGTTFNYAMSFTVDERVSMVTPAWPDQSGSSVTTQTGNNFTVDFNSRSNPNYNSNLPQFSFFLQVPIVDERGLVPTDIGIGNQFDITPGPNNDNQALLFVADGVMHHVTIDLNSAVAQLAKAINSAPRTSDQAHAGSAVLNMSSWSLGGIFIGPESISPTGMSFDVSHPVINIDRSKTFTVGQSVSSPVTISQGSSYAYPLASVSHGNLNYSVVSNNGAQSFVWGPATNDLSGQRYSSEQFADGRVYVDDSGSLSKVDEVYLLMFGRHVDPLGVGWASQADTNGVQYVAQQILNYGVTGNLTDSQLVQQAYSNVLGSAPDQNAINHWTSVIQQQGRAGFAATFVATPDAQAHNTTEQTQAADLLYRGILGRAADPTGLGGLASALANGNSISSAANGLITSGEFAQTGWGATNTSFVQHLFINGLGRAANYQPAANDSWVAALNNGANRGDIAAGILFSREGIVHQSTTDHVSTYFLPNS